MLLVEFDSGSAMVSQIVALTNQIQQDLDDGKFDENFTVDQLLDYFQSMMLS